MTIDPCRAIEAAEEETGLSEWGHPGFREGLDVFASAINEDTKRLPHAVEAAQGLVHDLLVKRLMLYRDRARYPEIAAQKVEKPLIVIGMPRSGTTFLHALLAQDPRARSPLAWELEAPFPPPRAESFDSDPRIAECQQRMELIPEEFKRRHMIGARLPDECNSFTMLAFNSSNFSAANDLPTYVAWYLKAHDEAPYDLHRHMLQHLQAFVPREYWVLKSPPHMFHLPRLIETYPDARLVFPHRDPVATLPSLSSLIAFLRSQTYGTVDKAAVGREMADYWRTAFDRAMAFRDSGNEARFVDVHYNEMIRAPLDAVRKVYRHFGMTLTPEAEEAMQRFLAAQPKDKHGAHAYSIEEFGLDRSKLHEEYGPYLDRYGVKQV